MKALIIGGTGVISTDVVKLALSRGWDITLLNRGRQSIPRGVRLIACDARDGEAMRKALEGERFDVAANFIGYLPEQVEQDIRLLDGKCDQYLFISTCCVYQKPGGPYLTTESSPLRNLNSLYGRRKIACEEALTWNQYLEQIERIIGRKAEVVHIATDFICQVIPALHDDLKGDKTVNFLFDNTKIRQFVPGFAASISYYQGVKESIEYLRAHPELQQIDAGYIANYEKVLAAYAGVLKG
jgi:nucleoside-diphosphate-sugar epimerase